MNTYVAFMLESNRIEGEDRINPKDEVAVKEALKGVTTLKDILHLHSIVGDYLNADWVGKLRGCDVSVGSYIAPHWKDVPTLMNRYVEDLPTMDSWKAHNEFEKIHPFRDLNGRVGRLIWISKAVKEGCDFQIPFLQRYYYQTLERYEQVPL